VHTEKSKGTAFTIYLPGAPFAAKD